MAIQDAINELIRTADSQNSQVILLQEMRDRMDAQQQALLLTLGVELFSPFGDMFEAIEGHRAELVQMFKLQALGMQAEAARLRAGGS